MQWWSFAWHTGIAAYPIVVRSSRHSQPGRVIWFALTTDFFCLLIMNETYHISFLLWFFFHASYAIQTIQNNFTVTQDDGLWSTEPFFSIPGFRSYTSGEGCQRGKAATAVQTWTCRSRLSSPILYGWGWLCILSWPSWRRTYLHRSLVCNRCVCVLYASLSVPLSHSLHCSKF